MHYLKCFVLLIRIYVSHTIALPKTHQEVCLELEARVQNYNTIYAWHLSAEYKTTYKVCLALQARV